MSNKFKKGDKVKRTGSSCFDVNNGDIYTIRTIGIGMSEGWFNLQESNILGLSFHKSNFELYTEKENKMDSGKYSEFKGYTSDYLGDLTSSCDNTSCDILLSLHRAGIDTEITVRDARITCELTYMKTGVTLGVATSESLETNLSILMTRFALDSLRIKSGEVSSLGTTGLDDLDHTINNSNLTEL